MSLVFVFGMSDALDKLVLPDEILRLIFILLDPETFANIAEVCPEIYESIVRERRKRPLKVYRTLGLFMNQMTMSCQGRAKAVILPSKKEDMIYPEELWSMAEPVVSGGEIITIRVELVEEVDGRFIDEEGMFQFDIDLSHYHSPLTLGQFLDILYEIWEGYKAEMLEITEEGYSLYYWSTPENFDTKEFRLVEPWEEQGNLFQFKLINNWGEFEMGVG